MSGLSLCYRDFKSIYYCKILKDGSITDGHLELVIALSYNHPWVPAPYWKFKTIAPLSLVGWNEQ